MPGVSYSNMIIIIGLNGHFILLCIFEGFELADEHEACQFSKYQKNITEKKICISALAYVETKYPKIEHEIQDEYNPDIPKGCYIKEDENGNHKIWFNHKVNAKTTIPTSSTSENAESTTEVSTKNPTADTSIQTTDTITTTSANINTTTGIENSNATKNKIRNICRLIDSKH